MTTRRTGRMLAVLILAGCVSGMTIARANGTDADSLWNYSLDTARQCQGAMNDGMKSAAACFLGDGINRLFDQGMGLANQRGKEAFGEHFSITGDVNWTPDVGSTGGLDMVTPFAFATPATDGTGIRSAAFLQQGVTRWRDGFGTLRNDLRHGLVHRFRVGDKPDADVVGLSSFYLQSAEHGHEVLALGLDYFGRWGTGELRYFAPTTGWTMVRPGHEERPLEGVELGTRLHLTTTVDLSVTGYQWEAEDGSGDRNRGTRLGFNWRPHPWLSFDTTWDGGNDDDAMAAGMHLNIPLGPRAEKTRLGMVRGGRGRPLRSGQYVPGRAANRPDSGGLPIRPGGLDYRRR